jgi:ADP-ribose pyrophosphatase YjhB (NUDIX family)
LGKNAAQLAVENYPRDTEKIYRVSRGDHHQRKQAGFAARTRDPRGFLEYGEQAEEAVQRELLEEIALKLENVQLFRVHITNLHIEFFFRAETSGVPEIKSGEIKSLRWFGAHELPDEMPLAQKSLVKKVLSGEI